MKALPVGKLPEGDWLFEIKHDGYRALAFKDGKDVRLVSRNRKAFDYPQRRCSWGCELTNSQNKLFVNGLREIAR